MSKRNQPMAFAILASGTGTNARVLLEYAKKKADKLCASVVISDRAEAPVLKIAEEFGVPSFIVDHRNEGSLLALFRRYNPEWVCLAGYKRIIGKGFLGHFWDKNQQLSKVMNIHPSLLPAYPGLHGYERAFADGVKVSGVTVHLVDSGLDTGKVILQESFAREEGDTLEKFMKRGQKIEHQLFPRALELAAAGKIKLLEIEGKSFVSIE